MLTTITVSRNVLMGILVSAIISFFGLMALGQAGGQNQQPEVTDPWCTISECDTGIVKEKVGYWDFYAGTTAEHHDEFGDPQPVTAIAHAEGTVECGYPGAITTYHDSNSDSESGYGTVSTFTEVSVGGTACMGDNIPKSFDEDSDCNCTS